MGPYFFFLNVLCHLSVSYVLDLSLVSFLIIFIYLCSRNLTCMMEVKKDEKQAAVLDKGEEDECLVELYYIGTMF